MLRTSNVRKAYDRPSHGDCCTEMVKRNRIIFPEQILQFRIVDIVVDFPHILSWHRSVQRILKEVPVKKHRLTPYTRLGRPGNGEEESRQAAYGSNPLRSESYRVIIGIIGLIVDQTVGVPGSRECCNTEVITIVIYIRHEDILESRIEIWECICELSVPIRPHLAQLLTTEVSAPQRWVIQNTVTNLGIDPPSKP